MKVLLFAPNASTRMGGEAVLPLHYLRELNAAGIEAELLTHARCRDELTSGDYARYPLHFVEDAAVEKRLWQVTKDLPTAASEAGDIAIGTITGYRMRAAAAALVRSGGFDLVHQVTPVSPRAPSFLSGLGVPIVIGPMNGNMSFPPGFEEAYGEGTGRLMRVARGVSDQVNAVFPGKRGAATILVANERTKAGLPGNVDRDAVRLLTENGIDLSSWTTSATPPPPVPRFVFVGRLVRLKAVDVLLDALTSLPDQVTLTIIGDGPEETALAEKAEALGLSSRVSFEGFKSAAEVRAAITGATALLLPSLHECGGAVVLEAMACSRPVIATWWGGPADYVVQDETGILVLPTSREALRSGFADAMRRLAGDPELCNRMGEAGRRRVEDSYGWRTKARQVADIYDTVVAEAR